MSSLTTSKGAPALSKWVAKVCRLFRVRNKRHCTKQLADSLYKTPL